MKEVLRLMCFLLSQREPRKGIYGYAKCLFFSVCVIFVQLAACASFTATGLARRTSLGPIIEQPTNGEPYRLVISVHDQTMTLLKGTATVARYLVSTAKNGVGEAVDSGRTPRGRHAVAEKIGAGVAIGMVFEDRLLTTNFVALNTPGQTPVVTRILRLKDWRIKTKTPSSA
jgi:hypothetical protein